MEQGTCPYDERCTYQPLAACGLLLGFGLDAFMCVGRLRKERSKAHVSVMNAMQLSTSTTNLWLLAACCWALGWMRMCAWED